MADTTDLKSVAYGVGVRVPFPAPLMYLEEGESWGRKVPLEDITMADEATKQVDETGEPTVQANEVAQEKADVENLSTEAQEETSAEAVQPEAKLSPEAEQLAVMKDRYIRLMADFDNMRKRQARELEEGRARANERLLKELIPVFDHFEMALASAKGEDPFVQGVQMIATEFRKVLEQSGAAVIDASVEGTKVDPMKHEVLSMIPHETIPQGEIVTQFRKGWTLGGKVVRPAQIVVSAGAPVAPVEEAQDGGEA